MRTDVDLRLVEESTRHGLRFACEDCVHFDAAASARPSEEGVGAGEGGACEHGYPTEQHRRSLLRVGAVLSFCKEFELGGEPEPQRSIASDRIAPDRIAPDRGGRGV